MLPTLEKVLSMVGKNFGVIHRSEAITMNGVEGYLIWDYVIYNELTFVNGKTGEHTSLFTSFSDRETAQRFDEYVSKHSNKKEIMDSIRQLKELLDLGAITEDEFNAKKKSLLDKI